MNSVIKDLKNLNHRRLWKPFMEKYHCQIICEVGVRKGKNLIRMTEHSPKIAVAVDSWIDDGVKSRNDLFYSQSGLNRQYEAVKRMALERPFLQIYREYSISAAKHFADNYFDLIYIDADHTYRACSDDIESWYPKVKKGKFLIGDDYFDIVKDGIKWGVIDAVGDFAKANNLAVYELPSFGWAIIKK